MKLFKAGFVVGLLLSIAASVAVAQTTVTLQVTDAGSQSWNNGTYAVTLSSSPFQAQNIGENAIAPMYSGSLNATGGASLTLAAGTWSFRVCPLAALFGAGTFGAPLVPCYSSGVAISGSTQTVTLAPPAIALAVNNAGMNVRAYADAEVTASFIGLKYFNLTSGLERIWNGSAWVDQGAGLSSTYAGLNETCGASTVGVRRAISDSTTNTWGAVVSVGGGADPVGIVCNGTAWTVYSK